jgi:hypothetical protein
MGKASRSCALAFLSVCFLASAQQNLGGDNLKSLAHGQLEIPALSLANAQPFSFPSTLGWIDATPSDFLPAFTPASLQTSTAAAARFSDSSKQAVDLPKNNLLDSVHGEVGILYGHSIGKFDRDMEAGYIFGQVGDDKLQISVGGMYEHWSGKTPRFGR